MQPHQRLRRLFVLTCSSILAFSTAATAQEECTAPPYRALSHDKHFLDLACEDGKRGDFENSAQYYLNRFGFQKTRGWDRKDYGWGKECAGHDDGEGGTTPLGRTLGTISLLERSYTDVATDWNDREGPWVRTMYGYVAGGYNGLKDLRAGQCDDQRSGRFHDGAFLFGDDYIIFYQRAFANNLIRRTGVLVHENWHLRTGRSHQCGEWADDYYYSDYRIFKRTCSGGGRPSCPGEWIVNPNPSQLNTYAAEGYWALDYWLFADQNVHSKRDEWAWSLFTTRMTDKICNTESIPEALAQFL